MAPARSWPGRFPLVRQVAVLAATAGLLLAVSLGLWLSSHGAGALLCAALASAALVCSAIGAATCSGVDRRARRMAAASGAAHAASGTMLVATGRQSERVDLVAAAVGELLGSIRAVSKAASDAAAVARRSLDAAAKGAGAANDTIRGMVDIRTQIQDTSKRIKRLGERSQEIGEIVELIADISEQTTLLALNASIQAAAAGEAGRGFSLVAEEVQQLAERSAEATRAIAGLVKSIQNDTIDAMVAMERSIADVVEGARRADSAGRALDEIQQVTHQQSALIDAISGASTSQRAVTARIADHMDDVRRLTHDVGDGASATARAVADLDSLTGDLRGSISGVRP
jgi:twitching motility protein PilJ